MRAPGTWKGPPKKDITGQRFGLLVAIAPSGKRRRETLWSVQCDCGGTSNVIVSALTSGSTRSCGCRVGLALPKTQPVHGYFGTPTYESYHGMLQRCGNPANKSYPRYGAKGITVCERWRGSFIAFLEDMGERPQGKTLDRKNGALGYSPDNCKWSTPREQVLNRAVTKFVTLDGKTQCLKDWFRELGTGGTVYYRRVAIGMSPAEALLDIQRMKQERAR